MSHEGIASIGLSTLHDPSGTPPYLALPAAAAADTTPPSSPRILHSAAAALAFSVAA